MRQHSQNITTLRQRWLSLRPEPSAPGAAVPAPSQECLPDAFPLFSSAFPSFVVPWCHGVHPSSCCASLPPARWPPVACASALLPKLSLCLNPPSERPKDAPLSRKRPKTLFSLEFDGESEEGHMCRGLRDTFPFTPTGACSLYGKHTQGVIVKRGTSRVSDVLVDVMLLSVFLPVCAVGVWLSVGLCAAARSEAIRSACGFGPTVKLVGLIPLLGSIGSTPHLSSSSFL